MNELCKGDGKHENRGSEDDRNDTGLIHLERQVGGVSAIHSASNDTLCILDRNSALPFIDFDDHQDHNKSNDKEQKQLERRNGTDLQVIDHCGDSLREAGYDTTEDDEGNTITDPVFRNFSPIHMRRQVPAVRTTTTNTKYSQLLSTRALLMRRA